MQQSVLQQAEAAAASHANSATPRRQEALLHDTDTNTLDSSEDDMPPPAYGNTCGELHAEKEGFSASVADDGRVNIRIKNHRLSQIFNPALGQQLRAAQDSTGPPPPPYIPPSLGGDVRSSVPPPPLNIVMQVVGSRGDVQPFIALGKVLLTYGHRVRLATHPNFKDFVENHGLEFFSIGGNPSQLMAFMVKNPSLMPRFRTVVSGDVCQRRRDVAEYIQGCWRSCYKAGDGMDPNETPEDQEQTGQKHTGTPFVADCIIANPPSFAHVHCAEKLGIPLHIMFTMPYSPTQAFPHPLANIQSSNADPQLSNYISYAMIEVLTWQGLGGTINRFRARCLGLDPISLIWAPGLLHRLKIPHTYCWSPALIPKPQDWGHHISITGFPVLNSPEYTPAPELRAFLDAGPLPVYIGFGSIVLDDPNAMTQLLLDATKQSGQRVLLSKGWGGMGADDLSLPDNVFLLDNVPHDWLFERVSCVVHHGGAGTTAAGITAGRPTVIVPFFGDQPFWGAMVARAGAGPHPIPHKQLTSEKLADAIHFCLMPATQQNANDLASKIAAERGSESAAQSFHQFLMVDRLRCTLASSRAAVWRLKRTKIRLSAFAACTLANAGLLDFHNLELYRSQEYETDEGPWDPISGGFVAVCGAFSSMAMGIGSIPTETYKALKLPFRNCPRQSQTPLSTNSHLSHETVPLASTDEDYMSLSEQGSFGDARSWDDSSDASILSSDRARASMIDASSHQTSDQYFCQSRIPLLKAPALGKERASTTDGSSHETSSQNSNQSRPPMLKASPPRKEKHDMMRPTGPHTSKGLGRTPKALVQGPMNISTALTQGSRNIAKAWGDDTFRPLPKITGFVTGATAAGTEFGLGWYEGVTGIVTQPWNGAKKEGAVGFAKGVGKGLGGAFVHPLAGSLGILSYTMKGVHKELQKLYRGSVQDYIIASRTAQGYEEWLQSSDAEKEDVVVRWKLVQKHPKLKHGDEEMVRDVLETQRTSTNGRDEERRQGPVPTADSSTTSSLDIASFDPDNAILVDDSPRTSGASPAAVGINETSRQSTRETARTTTPEDGNVERAIHEFVSQLQDQRHQSADDRMSGRADLDAFHNTPATREAGAQSVAGGPSHHHRIPRRAVGQSSRDQTRTGIVDSRWGVDASILVNRDDDFQRASTAPEEWSGQIPAVAGGSSSARRHDPGHLAGVTQREFEARNRGQQREKTTREKTEEEIVMAYVKKQSLLEERHHSK